MDCNKIVELLSEYMDGMLSDELNKEVESHINTCSKCRQEYDMLKTIVNSCHQLDAIDLPDDFHQKLHDRLIEENSNIKHENRFKYRGKRYTAVAAVLVLVISLGVALNSGVLSLGSQKKAKSTGNKEVATNESLKKDAPAAAAAPAAPQYSIKSAEDSNNLKTGGMAKREVQDQSLTAADNSRQRIVYNVVTVNLNESDYKKQFENIGVIIEGFGGYLKQKEPASYLMPEKDLDAFITKLRDGYNINDISVESKDITDEYTALQKEIAEMEGSLSGAPADGNNGTGNTESDTKSLLDKKKSQLKELNDKIGFTYIQINKN